MLIQVALFADRPADRHAVHPGQHQIEHDDAVRLGAQPIEGVLPVGDGVAVVAGAPQLLGDQLANAALVLDHKDATGDLGQLGGRHPKDWIL